MWVVGFVAALCTAFYMFRLITLTFWSPSRITSHEVDHHVHESPKSMTVPLIILAIASISAGWLGVPKALGGTNRFERFLEPVFVSETTEAAAAGELPAVSPGAERSAEHKAETALTPPKPEGGEEHGGAIEYILMGLSVSLGAIGYFAAKYFYGRAEKDYREPIHSVSPVVYNTLFNKYYVDEIYDATIVKPVQTVSREGLWRGVDVGLIDGAVNGVAAIIDAGSMVLRRLQTGSVRAYAGSLFIGVVLMLGYYLWR